MFISWVKHLFIKLVKCSAIFFLFQTLTFFANEGRKPMILHFQLFVFQLFNKER